ncbi:MAG: glycosyltransferase family 87 protein [Chloroflexota bacterium]
MQPVREMIRTVPKYLIVLLVVALPTILTIILFSFLLLKIFIPSLGKMTHAFPAYYTAAHLLLDGQLDARAYNNAWFIEQVHITVDPSIDEIMTPSLPTQSLIMAPLVRFSPIPARDLWLWFSLIFLFGGIGMLIWSDQRVENFAPKGRMAFSFFEHRTQQRISFYLIFASLSFLFPAVAANFFIGQTIILFFFLLSVTFFGVVTDRNEIAGVALGLTFMLKFLGLPLWFLFLLHGRWRALGWGIGTITLIFLITLPLITWQTWLAFLEAAWTVTGGATRAVPAYQTTAGFFTHLFLFDPVWNPSPLIHWPLLSTLLPTAIALFAIGITLWRGRNPRVMRPLFAALIPLGIILLPVAEEHHFVLLLISIFIIGQNLLTSAYQGYISVTDWAILGVAILLLIIPIPYQTVALDGGWGVLRYPRLFGGWLIWMVAFRQLKYEFTTL